MNQPTRRDVLKTLATVPIANITPILSFDDICNTADDGEPDVPDDESSEGWESNFNGTYRYLGPFPVVGCSACGGDHSDLSLLQNTERQNWFVCPVAKTSVDVFFDT